MFPGWNMCYNIFQPVYRRLAHLVRASGLHPEGERFESVTAY